MLIRRYNQKVWIPTIIFALAIISLGDTLLGYLKRNAEIQFSLIHDRHVLDSLVFNFLTYKMGDIIAPGLLMVFMGLNVTIVKKGFAHTDLVLLIKY